MSFFIYLGLIPILAFVALIAMLHVALPGELPLPGLRPTRSC
jgi:hypothetical protein